MAFVIIKNEHVIRKIKSLFFVNFSSFIVTKVRDKKCILEELYGAY